MIITQAPVRISFFGGGSDFPEHFERHGGTVLVTAIDRFAYVTIQRFHHEFFDHRLHISYRKTEACKHASEIEHPAIRVCLEKLGIEEGAELHYMADLPAKTGLGSSSTFVVAMLQALHAYRGQFCSAQSLADEAIEVERHILKEIGGVQDQIIAAYGGTCLIRFDRTLKFSVSQIPLPRERIQELQDHMLLLYTGIQRESYSVMSQRVKETSSNGDLLCEMSRLAEAGAEILADGVPIIRFGELLHETWLLKRQLANVSLPVIDEAYEIGRREGAAGGKLLGAGQGGFLLFIAKPEYHERIKTALPDMISLRVGINAPGSRVIFAQGNA